MIYYICLLYLQLPVSLDFIDKLFFNYYSIRGTVISLINYYYRHRVKNAKFLVPTSLFVLIRKMHLHYNSLSVRHFHSKQRFYVIVSTIDINFNIQKKRKKITVKNTCRNFVSFRSQCRPF